MKQPTLVFFDLETTNTDILKAEIVQIGAVAVSPEFEIFDEFEVKLDFDVKAADPEALKVNGYDPGLWGEVAIMPSVGCDDFAKFCRKYSSIRMVSKYGKQYSVAQLVGHNAAAYDSPLIFGACKRYNIFLPASFKVLDTLQRALWYFQERPDVAQPENHQLVTLAAYFGVDAGKSHDALEDCKTTVGIYRAILERLK